VVAGKYTVVRLIAAGGMSQVYLARQQTVKRDVALKIVDAGAISGEPSSVALRNEAFLAGKISHPHIVSVFDHGEAEDGHQYLVMEYLHGMTLSEILAREGPMDYIRALRLVAQVCDALAVLHEAGWVHRDLKPSNLFVVQAGVGQEFIKLLDFGITVPARRLLPTIGLVRDRAGTPLYMSPEQVLGGAVDGRSDLYSAGAVLYELLTGRTVCGPEADDASRSLPTPISIVRPSTRIPRGLDDFLLRLLARDPSQRPRDAREVAMRLRQMLPSRSEAGSAAAQDLMEVGAPDASFWYGPGAQTVRVKDPPFVNRRRELERVGQALDSADSGQGAILWFTGTEGSGKSFLGQKVLEVAGSRGFLVLHCPGSGQGSLMGAWRSPIRDLLGARKRDDVRAALLEIGLGPSVLDDPLVEGLSDLLFPGPASFDLLRTNREAFSTYIDSAVERFFRTIALTRKVAIFLDDFHLADAMSATFLEHLCRSLQETPAPIVVVLASQPLGPSPAGDGAEVRTAMDRARSGGCQEKLAKLSDRDVDALIDGMSPLPCELPVRRVVRRAAAGNPMFAIQMFRHLSSNGALTQTERSVRLVPGAATDVPAVLLDLLVARVDAFRRQVEDGPQAADVLTRVVLLGPRAGVGNVWSLLTLEGRLDLRDRLDALLDRLVADGFVNRVPWTSDDFLALAHPLMREAILRGLPESASARLHLLTAQVLERAYSDDLGQVARDLGEHYYEAGFFDRAADFLLLAGESAVEDARFMDGHRIFSRAETCLERLGLKRDPRMGRVILALAELLAAEGLLRDAETRLSQIDENGIVGPDSPDRWKVLELKARVAEAQRRTDEALRILADMVRLFRDKGDRHRAASAMLQAAAIRMNLGDNASAARDLEEAEDLVSVDGETRTMGLVHLTYGRLMRKIGSPQQTFDHLGRALAILSGPRDFAERAEALFFEGAKLLEIERPAEALEVFQSGVLLCESVGFARGLAAHLTNKGLALVDLGRHEEARPMLLRALYLRERMSDLMGMNACLTGLADMALLAGDWASVIDLSRKSLHLARQVGYTLGERVCQMNLAKAFRALGDPAESRKCLQAVIETTGRDRAVSRQVAGAHEMLADLLREGGDAEGALNHFLDAADLYDTLQLHDRATSVRNRITEVRAAEGNGGGS
jgi:tetratricopeptide (TPR) repeat protein